MSVIVYLAIALVGFVFLAISLLGLEFGTVKRQLIALTR